MSPYACYLCSDINHGYGVRFQIERFAFEPDKCWELSL